MDQTTITGPVGPVNPGLVTELMARKKLASPAAIPKSAHKNPVCVAVRELRQALGESQQQFAQRMQMAIRTIARYETIRPPKGRVLFLFHNLAKEAQQSELQRIFDTALRIEVGLAVKASDIILIDEPQLYDSETGLPIPMSYQDIDALKWMLVHSDEYGKELRIWERISRAAKQDKWARVRTLEIIVKLLKTGKTKKEIEQLLRVRIKADPNEILEVRSNPPSARSKIILERWVEFFPDFFTKKAGDRP